MDTNRNDMQSQNAGESITDEEREQFLMRRGWDKANTEERKELSEHWNDGRIRMALDMGLG